MSFPESTTVGLGKAVSPFHRIWRYFSAPTFKLLDADETEMLELKTHLVPLRSFRSQLLERVIKSVCLGGYRSGI